MKKLLKKSEKEELNNARLNHSLRRKINENLFYMNFAVYTFFEWSNALVL
jgi:hypothetical protein